MTTAHVLLLCAFNKACLKSWCRCACRHYPY
eukprot:jgi/Botrbrau1/17841/Bobra.0127s0084.1